MFCPNCGRELFGDARFCSGCGSARPHGDNPGVAPSLSPSPPRIKPSFKGSWRLQTSDWTGECPVCHLGHTAETTTCPNDGSPLVVAFNASKRNPFAFPIHTAEMRCSKNCGFSSQVISCNNDSTLISESFLRFRMPLVRTILHNGLHLLLVALGLLAAAIVLLVVGVCGYLISLAKGPDAGADRLPWVIVLVVLAGALWSGGLVGKYFDGVKACYRNWWPFRRTFNFAEADKAIEAQEIAKARAESVKSAKYSRRRM